MTERVLAVVAVVAVVLWLATLAYSWALSRNRAQARKDNLAKAPEDAPDDEVTSVLRIAERNWEGERRRMRETLARAEEEQRRLVREREEMALRIESMSVSAPEAKSQGPARWELNTPFKEYLAALAIRLADHLPEGRHDREKLADRAKISITTVEKLLRAETNSTIHTLYSIANARGLRLSVLFEEAERELERAEIRGVATNRQ